MSFNKVILVGNLTRAPELKYTANKGTALVKTAIAVNRVVIINGEKQDEVCFIELTFWGRTAEVANQYLQKGSKVLIEGHLILEQWQDQNGQNRSRHSVTVESMQMLDKKEQNNEQGFGYNQNTNYNPSQNSNYGYNANQNPNYNNGYNAGQNSNYNNGHNANNSYQTNSYNQNAINKQEPNAQTKQTQENLPSYDVDNDEIPF